ncbi:MAG: energy transducer TonB [Betaproteobacteria bacterium]|nr:energy transducer TonB [Betaproteobacteria bacterium]
MSAKPKAPVVAFTRRAKRGHQIARQSLLSELDARLGRLEARFERVVTRLDQRVTRGPFDRRFQIALTGSILVHLLVISLVTFKAPQPASARNDKPLEVILVNAKSKAKPAKAQALAQHNLDGGGNTDAERRAKSPLPALRNDPLANDLAQAQQRVAQLEREVQRQVMTRQQSRFETAAAPPQPTPQAEPQPNITPKISEADIQRSLNIQRMEAEIAKMWDSYQKRPRRHSIGASAVEYRFARYVEDWRIKVERLGELHYPQAARDQKIYGSLLMTVSIRANGTVENIELRRSSGSKVLDDAARHIVRLGAPYAAFPPDIAKDVDVIDISRTWRFTSTDKLETD